MIEFKYHTVRDHHLIDSIHQHPECTKYYYHCLKEDRWNWIMEHGGSVYFLVEWKSYFTWPGFVVAFDDEDTAVLYKVTWGGNEYHD